MYHKFDKILGIGRRFRTGPDLVRLVICTALSLVEAYPFSLENFDISTGIVIEPEVVT
jgi:hypothetical protein